MRVEGPRFAYTRLGFSPHAILRPYFAPGNFIPCTVRDGTSFSTTLRPPIRFADPGRTWIVVTPPASDRGSCGSCGHTECSTQTFAVTGFVASLTSSVCAPGSPGAAAPPMCECVSMIPGVTYLPVPSITSASAGAVTFAPTCAILPFVRSTAPLRIVGPAAVRIVTLRMTVGRDAYGRYVLGKGSALGAETAPAPAAFDGRAALSRRVSSGFGVAGDCACAGVGPLCVVRVPDEQPATSTSDATNDENRM